MCSNRSMPPVGGQADFHRPRLDAKFGNNVWDGENQRGIIFFLLNSIGWNRSLLCTMIPVCAYLY